MDRSESRRLSANGVGSPHAHVLGVDGRGMSGLAQNLVQKGMAVTGSETEPGRVGTGWLEVGIRVEPEPVYRAITARTRLLVHGPEVRPEHSARLGALRRGVPQQTPADWLGGQMHGRIGIAVAGGRDAAMAAAMIGFVLTGAGLDPSVLLGTASPQIGGWSRAGAGSHIVAEWGGTAEDLAVIAPRLTVLMKPGCELDPWSEVLRRSLPALPADSYVLALGQHPGRGDDGSGSEGGVARPVEWASLERGGAWWGTDLREQSGRFRFRVFHRGRYVNEVRLRVAGRRGLVAALAAVATCDRLGVPSVAVRDGLEEFSGLVRDFERRGSYRGVTLVDDEADDPASVGDALNLARRTFGGRRVWAVYAAPGSGEPGRFASSFSAADRVVITERMAESGAAQTLAKTLTDAGIKAHRAADLGEAISVLDRHLEPGDVLLTLGAGDVGTIADAFIRRLPRDRQGR